MYRNNVILFIFFFVAALCPAQQNDKENYYSPRDLFVQQIISLVNSDSLLRNVRVLSGDTTTTVNDSVTRIITRRSRTSGNALAQAYLAEKLSSYGLTVELHHYDGSHPNLANVIAVQQGSASPPCSLIVCAHFDDIASGDTIPGADDNASGSAAVLEAARILSTYSTSATMVYALWNDEESGMIGSGAYARQSSVRKDSIIGVIDIDMIGYDSNNDGHSEIHTNNILRSGAITDTMISVNGEYNIGLSPLTYNPGSASSDHSSFWLYGYGAVMLIEGYWSGDFNPSYHTVNDKIQRFNPGFYWKCSKLAIGTAAALAGITGPTSVELSEDLPDKILLFQNYPNPFNPNTTISYQLSSQSHVTITLLDILGQVVATLVNQTESAGYKQVEWNASNLSSGIYFYRLYATGVSAQRVESSTSGGEATSVANPSKSFTSVKKMVLMK